MSTVIFLHFSDQAFWTWAWSLLSNHIIQRYLCSTWEIKLHVFITSPCVSDWKISLFFFYIGDNFHSAFHRTFKFQLVEITIMAGVKHSIRLYMPVFRKIIFYISVDFLCRVKPKPLKSTSFCLKCVRHLLLLALSQNLPSFCS